jgi:hypothetical protein
MVRVINLSLRAGLSNISILHFIKYIYFTFFKIVLDFIELFFYSLTVHLDIIKILSPTVHQFVIKLLFIDVY